MRTLLVVLVVLAIATVSLAAPTYRITDGECIGYDDMLPDGWRDGYESPANTNIHSLYETDPVGILLAQVDSLQSQVDSLLARVEALEEKHQPRWYPLGDEGITEGCSPEGADTK